MIKVKIDRGLTFFTGSRQTCYEVDLVEPARLRTILEVLGIPASEVHLAVINGQAAESLDVMVSSRDLIMLFPPFGGG